VSVLPCVLLAGGHLHEQARILTRRVSRRRDVHDGDRPRAPAGRLLGALRPADQLEDEPQGVGAHGGRPRRRAAADRGVRRHALLGEGHGDQRGRHLAEAAGPRRRLPEQAGRPDLRRGQPRRRLVETPPTSAAKISTLGCS
jgi:hypothetical protein